ncbi:HAD family hydrolase [Paenibacillus flagellatus]|uniref:HAD family hydrolase n=1 Tax=Paenibacillus flagellatus TaxID=2211139 RepID=UPI0013052C73|nr:HAD family hydrolase [Paenibacillus flagellatus]
MNRRFTPRTTKAVFFDMNNTLIDAKASFDACFLHVLTDFAGRWDPGEGDWNPRRVLETYRTEWGKLAAKAEGRPERLEEAKKKGLQKALRHYPFQVNDGFVRSFFREMHNQMREHAVPFAGVADTLSALSGAYALGVVTNGSKEQQQRVLRRLKLSGFIPDERVFASTRSGYRKPHPALFREALRATGVRAAESVMVGDSWKNDISGAIRCGMKAVWMNRAAGNGGKSGERTGSDGSVRRLGETEVPLVPGMKALLELFETR